jgi:hypothetical protein
MAFPMGENGCDLSEGTSHLAGRWANIVSDFSSIEFTAEGNIITEPSHCPVKTFETPIRQIVSSPVSSDLSKGIFPNFFSGRICLSRKAETVVGIRTFSSTLLTSLSLSTPQQTKSSTSVETKEIDSINKSSLDGHVAVDVQIHSSLEYAALVSDQGHIFKRSLLGGSDP